MTDDKIKCMYCGSSDYSQNEFDDTLVCNSCGKPFVYKLTDEAIEQLVGMNKTKD